MRCVCTFRGQARCAVAFLLVSSGNRWDERQLRFQQITFGAGADQGHDEHDCKFRVHEVPEACKTVIPSGRVPAWSFVVRGKSGSHDVAYIKNRTPRRTHIFLSLISLRSVPHLLVTCQRSSHVHTCVWLKWAKWLKAERLSPRLGSVALARLL